MRRLVLAALAALAAAPSWAMEWETIFQQGDWRVDINIFEDQSLNCEARTQSGPFVFSLYEEQNGDFEIAFFSNGWRFPEEEIPTQFRVTVDYLAPWIMDGTRFLQRIAIRPDPNADDLHRFLREVRSGRRLTLANAEGMELAHFSLRGSADNLDALAECGTRINQRQAADPFARGDVNPATDPFR
jgi:hypothetical protein